MIKKFKNKKTLIFTLVAVMLVVVSIIYNFAFADSTRPALVERDGIMYVYFELDHNVTNAQYKYYGYGYTVSVTLNGQVIHSEFMENSEFEPYMEGGKEKVNIKVETLMDKIGLATEYFSMNDLIIYLNGRIGIKKDGVVTHAYDSYDGSSAPGMPRLETGTVKLDGRTVPLNKDGKGIKDGIEHEYGVNWTGATEKNLELHFGIPIELPGPILAWDRYKVEYREIGTDKNVRSEKPYVKFESNTTITEYPLTVNGYEYSGKYKIDRIDPNNNKTPGSIQTGNSASVNIQKNANIYTIVFYYEKADPSETGSPVTIDIEYREETSTGKELLNKKTILSTERAVFNISSEKKDEYECVGLYVIGQDTEYFYSTNASFTISKEAYCKPVNGKLKVIFIYDKIPYVSIPKCSPDVYGDSNIINITMKRKDFESATEITVNNAILKIDDFDAGRDGNGNLVEGSHNFNNFDVYVGDGGNYYYTSYDNKSREISTSFKVPKSIFTQSSADANLYTTNIDVAIAATCVCYDGRPDADGDDGWAMNQNLLTININLIENRPPVADFSYYTQKKINGEIKGSINERAYVGQEVVVKNKAYDPNGKEDIDKLVYTLKDSSGKQYKVNFLILQGDMYFLDSENVNGDNIIFAGTTDDGDIKLIFTTEETWTINQYVVDIEGLNDIYEESIMTEILRLRPSAVIEDNINYRYPVTQPYNGKQNRIVMLDSSYSYVAEFYEGLTGVIINHNRDNWEIEPLNNQDPDSIKFSTSINKTTEDNIIKIKYQNLNNVKMMFKQTGQYKIRLQVTDTQGNVSEWTEKIITINIDSSPIVNVVLPVKEYRNSSGIAEVKISNISTHSTDEDEVVVENIKYRYDSNNDGRFEDESWFMLEDYILRTSNLGKYQFMITVKENFGQETLKEYISDEDYKRGSTILQTEIDNIAPDITDFKIITTE